MKEQAGSIVEKQVQKQVQELLVATVEHYQGPLPPPHHIAEYEQVVPGSGERFLKMAEEEGEARRRLLRKASEDGYRLQRNGQLFGFIIVLTALIGGIWLMAVGKSIEGAGTAIAAVGGVAGLFVWSRRRSGNQDDRANSDLLPPKPEP